MDPTASIPAAVLEGDIMTKHLETTLSLLSSEPPPSQLPTKGCGCRYKSPDPENASDHNLLSSANYTTITPGGSSRSQAWDEMVVPSPWGSGGFVEIGSLADVTGLPESYILSVDNSWKKVRLGAAGSINSSAPADAYSWVANSHGTHGCGVPGRLLSTPGENMVSSSYTVGVPKLPASVAQVCEALLLAGSSRSSRVLCVADLCVRLILQTEGLLQARELVLAGEPSASCFYAEIRTFDRPLGLPPLISGPPAKGSGFSIAPLPGFSQLCARDGVCGLLSHPCVYAMGMGYCCGLYGRRMGSTWAPFESGFFYDYSLPLHSVAMDRTIRKLYTRIFQGGGGGGDGILGNHVKDIVLIKDMNFTAIRAKASMEDASLARARPCLIRWFSLRDLACYRLVDAGFCHP